MRTCTFKTLNAKRSSAWLASVLLAAAVLTETSHAQPPGNQRPPPGGPGRRGGPPSALERAVDDLKLSPDQRLVMLASARNSQEDVRRVHDLATAELLLKLKAILSHEDFGKVKEGVDRLQGGSPLGEDAVVARILSFDKTQSGKVSKDDLPERLQYLIAKGDLNQDGSLDRDEIKKLAAELPKEGLALGNGSPGRGTPGGRGGAGRAIPAGALEKVLGDLNLAGHSKESVSAAMIAHRENVRKMTEFARADLRLKASEVLNEEEFKKFTEVLNRLPATDDRPGGPDGRRGGPPRLGFRPPANP